MLYEDIFQLVAGTLASGLTYVSKHLEKQTGAQVLFADRAGSGRGPLPQSRRERADDSGPELPDLARSGYLYAESEETLYYRVPCPGDAACFIVKGLGASRLELCLAALQKAELAVRIYFSRLQQAETDSLLLERELQDYLFGGSDRGSGGECGAAIGKILELGGGYPQGATSFRVEMLGLDESAPASYWQKLAAFAADYGESGRDFIAVKGPELLALVLPQTAVSFDVSTFRAAAEKKFETPVRAGRGEARPLPELRQSADEARLAFFYPRLMGTGEKHQSFADMGVFTAIFSQPLPLIAGSARRTVEPLLAYDENNGGCLLPTLTELVDSGFNLRKTAQSLYIHVNTLYYRIRRIEGLLKTDLSLMSARVDIFTALKTWALLGLSGLGV
jgi:hypothetical protein